MGFVWDQPDAHNYYHMFRKEPIPGPDLLQVDKTIALGTNSVSHLLEQIANNAKPGSNILIVAHGTENGLYFYFGDPKNKIYMDTDVLTEIQLELAGQRSEQDTGQTVKMAVREWQVLRDKLKKVQDLKLNRVDLRACQVGKDKQGFALSAQQVFFNCQTACAPKIYDAFGVVQFGQWATDSKVWADWLKAHPNNVMTGSAGTDGCAAAAQYQPKFSMDGLADSGEAVVAWVKVHLPPGTFTKSDTLYFHGVTDLNAAPIFAGDTAAFTGLLAQAFMGKAPSRKVDVNSGIIP